MVQLLTTGALIVQRVKSGVGGVRWVGTGGMIGAYPGRTAAAFQSTSFGVLADDVSVETTTKFYSCKIALLAVDSVVVAGG